MQSVISALVHTLPHEATQSTDAHACGHRKYSINSVTSKHLEEWLLDKCSVMNVDSNPTHSAYWMLTSAVL
jgi:hypothetical protein